MNLLVNYQVTNEEMACNSLDSTVLRSQFKAEMDRYFFYRLRYVNR